MIKTAAYTIILSLIPGLAVWLLGKHRLAVQIVIGFLLLSALFFIIPSIIVWYIWCAAYIGQMVYSVKLSIWLRPEDRKQKPSLNADFAVPLPKKLAVAKDLADAVFETLSRHIRSDDELEIALLGLEPVSLKYEMVGVTENNLILAESTNQGDAKNVRQIKKTNVSFVSLQVGERSSLMKITFEEDCHPVTELKIPRKLRFDAIEFVKEFPGIWGYDRSSFADIFSSIDKINWNPTTIVISVISMVLVIFGITSNGSDTISALLKILSFSFGFFLLGCPYAVFLLRQFKKETVFTSMSIVAMIFTTPAILYCWFLAARPIGLMAINLILLIKQ
jgi:hypothetical protein